MGQNEYSILFNEHSTSDKLTVNGQRIQTIEALKYLGATLNANNNQNNHSTFTIQLNEVGSKRHHISSMSSNARDIRTRCKIVRGLQKIPDTIQKIPANMQRIHRRKNQLLPTMVSS